MAWTAPTTRQTGDLITADIWNSEVVDNLSLLYGANFQAAYDSGWFAVTYGTAYTRAHGLGTTPRLVAVLWASTANPMDWHIVTAMTHLDLTRGASILVTTAGIMVTTGSSSSHGVLLTPAVQTSTGYYRMLAWR